MAPGYLFGSACWAGLHSCGIVGARGSVGFSLSEEPCLPAGEARDSIWLAPDAHAGHHGGFLVRANQPSYMQSLLSWSFATSCHRGRSGIVVKACLVPDLLMGFGPS